MTLEIGLVLTIAAVAMALFVTERLRMDIVAMLVLVSLQALSLITPTEALSGFSNQATITVAAMFILAAGLQNTGALAGISHLLGKARSPTAFLLTLFAVLAVIAPFVNNTAVVAVFMPVVIAASLQIGMSPTKALIPLSYVSQMIGVWTLIGTSTNLIVNALAQEMGYSDFTMFQFLPLGVICTIAGCAYLLTFGRWLLPDEAQYDLDTFHESGRYVTELRLHAESKLIENSVQDSQLHKKYKVYVLELLRDGKKSWAPRAQKLKEGDVLTVRGRWPDLYRLKEENGLDFLSEADNVKEQPARTPARADSAESKAAAQKARTAGPENKRVMAEIMVSPNSITIGHRLAALERRVGSMASFIGVQRRGQILRDKLDQTVLEVGDILLVLIKESSLPLLRKNKDFIILSETGAPIGRGWRTSYALAIMALVVLLPVLGWMPIAISALVGAVAMVVANCVDLDDVYETVDWRILLLMAGLLPLGTAMSNSGASNFIVDHTIGLVADWGPHIVLAVLYLMALLLGELMSNSAAAVLLTPIGISTAQYLEADATPFLIAVTFSASTSFLTPVGYQTNTMVYGAGGYRFSDFVKVGLPLNLIFWILGVILIPIFWPF